MLFAYGLHHREERFRLRALRWLEEIKPESNVIINGFEVLGKKSCSAFDSQALMELKTKYCDNRLCLQCAVGNALLKLT